MIQSTGVPAAPIVVMNVSKVYKKGGGRRAVIFDSLLSRSEFELLVEKLISEGKRVGKAPWCADAQAESAAAWKLRRCGIKKRETMAETMARREREGQYC